MILSLGALGAGFAVVYWLRGQGDDGEKPLALCLAKTASTGCLALAALLAGASPWLTAGLAFGAMGDYALTRRGERAFLAGLIAFAIGHLLYIPAFLTGFGPAQMPPAWSLALLALPISIFWWLLPHTGRLRLPVLAYCVIITAMYAAALAVPPGPAQGLIRGGVALFVLSDLILALRLFRLQSAGQRRLAALTLWPMYFTGQALILAGGLTAAAL